MSLRFFFFTSTFLIPIFFISHTLYQLSTVGSTCRPLHFFTNSFTGLSPFPPTTFLCHSSHASPSLPARAGISAALTPFLPCSYSRAHQPPLPSLPTSFSSLPNSSCHPPPSPSSTCRTSCPMVQFQRVSSRPMVGFQCVTA